MSILILGSLAGVTGVAGLLLHQSSKKFQRTKAEFIERHRAAIHRPHSAFDIHQYPRPALFDPALPGNAESELLDWFMCEKPGKYEDVYRPLTDRLKDPELAPPFLEGLRQLRTVFSKPLIDPAAGNDPLRWANWSQASYGLEYTSFWFQARGRHGEALETGLMLLALTHLHERFNCERYENFVHESLSRQQAFRLLMRLFENSSASPEQWTWACLALDRVIAGRLPSSRAWEKHVYFTRSIAFNLFKDKFHTKDGERDSMLEVLDRLMVGRSRIEAMPPGESRWELIQELMASARGENSWMSSVDWDEVLKGIWEIEQTEPLARLAFALARYFAEAGRFPTRLSDLACRYITSIPTDPLHGMPYSYEALQRNAVIWTKSFHGALQWHVTVP